MVEPVTSFRTFIVPNTSDLPGAWGTSALNPNWQSVDALFGGVTTISLSATTTILLTVPATTGVWPGGNPSQSMNAMIKFTGAQTGSATIQFTLPGFYIINNKCTGTTFVKLSPATGTGNAIGAPPGQKVHVFFDGTDMDYVDFPTPGSAVDLHINTTTLPPWMTACSVAPYLIKDGTVYTSSIYPALSALLGSTYGGNGVTTFGVPDERNRFRLPVDTGTTGRVTVALNGVSGTTFGAAGGTSAPALTLGQLPTGITVTGTLQTNRQFPVTGTGDTIASVPAPSSGSLYAPYASSGPNWTGIIGVSGSLTSNNTLGSAHSVLNPTIVSFLPLLKT